jgi:hypothetical protein
MTDATRPDLGAADTKDWTRAALESSGFAFIAR